MHGVLITVWFCGWKEKEAGSGTQVGSMALTIQWRADSCDSRVWGSECSVCGVDAEPKGLEADSELLAWVLRPP